MLADREIRLRFSHGLAVKFEYLADDAGWTENVQLQLWTINEVRMNTAKGSHLN